MNDSVTLSAEQVVLEAPADRKKIGLITGLLLEADPLLQYKPWPIMAQITQFFEVQSIGSEVNQIIQPFHGVVIVCNDIINADG